MSVASSQSMCPMPSPTPVAFRPRQPDTAVRDLAELARRDPAVGRLCDILAIPSWSGYEHELSRYAAARLEEYGCRVSVDAQGNVLAAKGRLGSGEAYPAFTAHLDTVFTGCRDYRLMLSGGFIGGHLHGDGAACGVGGDDKCGVFVALEMARCLPAVKIALFVEEEIGCLGARAADHGFFDDAGYCIAVDCPEVGTVGGVSHGTVLFEPDGDFWRVAGPVANTYFQRGGRFGVVVHPYTDIHVVREQERFACVNAPAGYYNWHTMAECISLRDLRRIVPGCLAMVRALGNRLYDEGPARSLFRRTG